MFDDKTGWQKFCYFATIVMALGLIWTCAESLAMSFEYYWPEKIMLYVIAVCIVGLAVLGLRRIKSAFTEEEYVNNKPWILASGIVVYVFALMVSVAGSVHNAYFRMTHSEMEEKEVNEVHLYLSQVGDQVKSEIKQAISQYDNSVEAELESTILEYDNRDNRGPGEKFNGHMRKLEALLKVQNLDFVSPQQKGSSTLSEYQKDILKREVRIIKDREIKKKQEDGQEITEVVDSKDFKGLVEDLAGLQRDFMGDKKGEASRLLKRAFATRNDIAKRLDRFKEVVRNDPNLGPTRHAERPPSVEIRKLAYFYGEAFTRAKGPAEGVISMSKFRWAILLGIILELGLISFYYFGYLERRDHQ